jgi:antitoxin HicB
MSEKFYPIVVTPLPADEGGGFVGFAPDLQGCMSDGETQVEALQNTQEAIREWIEEALILGRSIPEPGSAAGRAKEVLERELKRERDEVGELRKKFGALSERVTAAERSIKELELQIDGLAAQKGTMFWVSEMVLGQRADTDDHVH